MNLSKRAVGLMIDSQVVNRYEVEPRQNKRVFLMGFNIDCPNRKEYWTITGRKGQYSSADAALAVLQADEAKRPN
jgi:hypothetical protein